MMKNPLLDAGQVRKLAHQVLTQESTALKELEARLDYDDLARAIEMLLAATGMVLVVGAGTSSTIARRLAHTLTCFGARSVYLDAGQSQHGYSAIISSADLVIVFSRGGETVEINHVLGIARERGARSIGILEATQSSTGSLCDVVLDGGLSPENDVGGIIPLASTLVQAAIGDILCTAYSEVHKLSEEEFGRVHPGGAVGLRLSGTTIETSVPGSMADLSLAKIKGMILDMDGVLWHGQEPLPGLDTFFKTLEEQGIRYVLATNNPSQQPKGFADKARRFGISIEDQNVITSIVATEAYLIANFPLGSRVHVIGEAALKQRIADAGFELADEEVVAVVAALERGFSYDTVKRGTLLIRGGAAFIGTNGDPSYPTEEGIVPGSGMMVTALAVSSDRSPIIMGKPERPIFDLALERLGLPADQVVSVGDRLDSDILGGQRAGMETILLLTGITSQEHLPGNPIQPTWVFENLPALARALQDR